MRATGGDSYVATIEFGPTVRARSLVSYGNCVAAGIAAPGRSDRVVRETTAQARLADARGDRTESRAPRDGAPVAAWRRAGDRYSRPSTRAGLWLLAMAASAAVGTHGIVYWDAGDYVRLAIDGGPSGLAARPAAVSVWCRGWFWRPASIRRRPSRAALVLDRRRRHGGAGAGACWRHVSDLDRAASLAAGVALALSPSFAHTSHQVLTDAPALALSIAALAAAARSQAVSSGLLLAAAIRRAKPPPCTSSRSRILLGRRAVVGAGRGGRGDRRDALGLSTAAVCAVVAGHVAIDRCASADCRGSRRCRSLWVLAAGPLPVVAGILALARRPAGRWLVVSVPAAIATVVLLFYPDGSFSPRYVLATVPLAFFLAAGMWLSARPRVLAWPRSSCRWRSCRSPRNRARAVGGARRGGHDSACRVFRPARSSCPATTVRRRDSARRFISVAISTWCVRDGIGRRIRPPCSMRLWRPAGRSRWIWPTMRGCGPRRDAES